MCGKCAVRWTVVLLHQVFRVRHLVDTRAIARPKKTNLNSSINLFLNHSCKSSILKIKCSFHSHFIYKVIFQQRRGGRMATDLHPLHITLTVRVARRTLCRMLLLRNLVGGAKQNHTMVLTVGDLGSFQHQPQQDSRGPLGPDGAFGPCQQGFKRFRRSKNISATQRRRGRRMKITPKRRQ